MRRRVPLPPITPAQAEPPAGTTVTTVTTVTVVGARRLVTLHVPPYRLEPYEAASRGGVPILGKGAIVRIVQGADATPEETDRLVHLLRYQKPARVTVLPIPRGTAAPAEVVQRARESRTQREVVESLLDNIAAGPELKKLCAEIMDEEGL